MPGPIWLTSQVIVPAPIAAMTKSAMNPGIKSRMDCAGLPFDFDWCAIDFFPPFSVKGLLNCSVCVMA